ncbi:MAG: hypothetical protein UHP27_02245 [Muribaculaceae bacterium]|nr:hypothetical protein [Muribaculaceae bacterium]
MSDIKIAGIMRAGAYSPNHIGNDAAIFNIVAEELRKRGCEVRVYTEDQFIAGQVSEDIIVNMCREQKSIHLLQECEDRGALVINSGYGIENCTRERMTRILVGTGIPYPKSLMVNTDEGVVDALKEAGIERCWIKRGDFHAMHKEDVSFVRHPQEAQEVLQEYFLRGIKRAVINIHLEGDLVKFYGVRGTNFFYWFYPFDAGHSKYGAEAINGPAQGIKFDEDYLRDICQQAAETLDVVVYGGDCIIGTDGSIQIIDFNDWPSFAPCRQEAGPQIARAIMGCIKAARQ